MDKYRRYMDRQEVSNDLHGKLLQLETVERKRKRTGRYYMEFAAVMACAVLVIGLGVRGLPGPNDAGKASKETGMDSEQQAFIQDSDGQAQVPPQTGTNSASIEKKEYFPALNGDRAAFVAQGPDSESKLAFPAILSVNYTSKTSWSEPEAACMKAPDGSFANPLSKDEITRIFWGEDGKPTDIDPKTDSGDFPIFLVGWADYLICGDAYYDGSGDLWRLVIHGSKENDMFEMVICPGRIPLDGAFHPELETTDVLGTAVTGWSSSFDCNGDGKKEFIAGSELMVGDYGVTFENIGSGGLIVDNDPESSAMTFNTMTVNHLVRSDGGLYLEHLLHVDDIPAWRKEVFETFEDALAEKEFAGYLPATAPDGYGEFQGQLNYQEGSNHVLWVRWNKGYDDVAVEVYLPEGNSNFAFEESLVDAGIPASYDWRLYDGPICDTVPEEYQLYFYDVTFRAEDMSLELVRARMHPHDTGGESCDFNILHENGTVVSYHCAGVSADYVWGMVEKTL